MQNVLTFLNNLLWRFTHRINRSITESTEYSLSHLPIIGLVGFIGFPLYYWIWSHLFPQPYENLYLRLIGSALFFGLLTLNHWPEKYKKHLKVYWCVTLLYSSSFFFTFMLLKNEGNFVWAMSMMAGLTLLILVAYDWVLVTVIFIVGSLLATIAVLGSNYPNSINMDNYWMQIPIYLFMVIVGSALNYKSSVNRQEQLKMLASVGAEITHELRTPLLSIEHNGKKIQSAIKKNNQAQHSELYNASKNIIDETHYANTIIDMLLMNLSGKVINTDQFSSHNIKDIINTAIKRYPFKSRQEKSVIKVQEDSYFSIWGSDILIVHILFNLIKNALNHTDINDTIHISSYNDKHYNHLVFKDTGKGIAAKKLPYIFDDFYTTSKLGAGTGIGLSFCKNVMKHINGKIECHSILGEFTQFTLSFPVVSLSDKKLAHPQPSLDNEPTLTVQSYLHSKNILLIDDEDIHHVLFDENLSAYNTQVFHAFNASAALHLLEEHSIDCIVIDIHMPGMNGIELAQAIRTGNDFTHFTHYATIPIIGLSSDPSEHVERSAYTCGMNAFLRKPTESKILVKALSQQIANSPITEKKESYASHTALSEDSPLYQLGAKLAHNINTPIITVTMCNKVFTLLFPTLLNACSESTPLPKETYKHIFEAPNHYKTSIQSLRLLSEQFWEAFKLLDTNAAHTLLEQHITSLQQHWQDIEQYNHEVLENLLPALLEAYNSDTDTIKQQISTSAKNCIDTTRHAQHVIAQTRQKLLGEMDYTHK